MNTPHSSRNLIASTQQSQDSTSFPEAFPMNACNANVISSDELIETIYGKINDLVDIRATLEEERSLCNSGWQAFNNSETDSCLPFDSSLQGPKALVTIFEQCSRAAGIPAADSMVQLKVHGRVANFPNNTRPDATIHLTKSRLPWLRDDTRMDHADVHMYVQFKKTANGGNFDDDVNNLLWNVHHRFHCDPCCRFVCGLTIEDTTARFWHFSRAAVMVSEPFDILKDADKLIHIFVSAARAKSPADLGFDPTITCTMVDPAAKQRQYKIEVSDNKDRSQESIDRGKPCVRTFITRRIIANYRAVGIRSRGTWIFEGSEDQQPDDTLVVIKDVWIDADLEVEGTVLENVREALKDTPDKLQLFLELLCHGCVLINAVKDLTQPLLKSEKIWSLAYSGKAASSPSTSNSKHTVKELSLGSVLNPRTEEPGVIGRRGDRRKHYRIVFKGKAGHALHDLKSHREVFTGLLGGVKGLHALHKAGYIHRDLSAGNVLLVKGGEGRDRGILIDLEYATRFPDTSKKGHDVRTGTMPFMAVEVNARRLVFLPTPEEDDSLSELLGTASSYLSPARTAVPWFHNPIHDIESAWWIALWTFHYINGVIGPSLFTDQSERYLTFLSPAIFPAQCSALPAPVLRLLNGWLSFMRKQYAELESLVSSQHHVSFDYNYVFEVTIQFVEAIVKALPNEHDSALPGEELATSADGPPTKRRKVQRGEVSS